MFETDSESEGALCSCCFLSEVFWIILQTLVRHLSVAITRLVIDPSETRRSGARGITMVLRESDRAWWEK